MSKFTVSSEAPWCCWRKKTLSVFTKQQQVGKQSTHLNEPDNYMNIFPWLLQWAPINEPGCLKFMHVPKAFISPRLSYEHGGGWSVWVEAIDSVYLRQCQSWRIQTRRNAEGGYLRLHTYTNPQVSHVINQITCFPVSCCCF